MGGDIWFFMLKCKSMRRSAQSAGETAAPIDWGAAVGQCPSGLNCILENPASILEVLMWSLPHPPHPQLLAKPGLPSTWGLRERERMGESFLKRKCVGCHCSSSLPRWLLLNRLICFEFTLLIKVVLYQHLSTQVLLWEIRSCLCVPGRST